MEQWTENYNRSHFDELSRELQREILDNLGIKYDILNRRMHLGKHKRKRYMEIPLDYMVWLIKDRILENEETRELIKFLKYKGPNYIPYLQDIKALDI